MSPPILITLADLTHELKTHASPFSCLAATKENRRCRNSIGRDCGEEATSLLLSEKKIPDVQTMIEAVEYCMCWMHADKQAKRVATALWEEMGAASAGAPANYEYVEGSMRKAGVDVASVVKENEICNKELRAALRMTRKRDRVMAAMLAESEKLVARLQAELQESRDEVVDVKKKHEASIKRSRDELANVKERHETSMKESFKELETVKQNHEASMREKQEELLEVESGLEDAKDEVEVLLEQKDQLLDEVEALRVVSAVSSPFRSRI